MADDKKKKYYESLVRAGVVPQELSYETFVSRMSGDKNYSDIVYSGLETASKLGIVESIPDKKTFDSVLRVFPTKPELKKDNFGNPVPETGENIINPIQATPESNVVPGGGPNVTGAMFRQGAQKQAVSQQRISNMGVPPVGDESGMPPDISGTPGQAPVGGQPVAQESASQGGVNPLAGAQPQQFQWSGQQAPVESMQPQQPISQGVGGISSADSEARTTQASPYQAGITKLGEVEAGFIGGIGSGLQGISELGYSIDSKIVNALKGTPIEGGFKKFDKPSDSWLYQAGQGLQDFAEKDLYRNPEYVGGFSSDVAGALGQVGSIMATGGFNPAGGILKLGRGVLTNRQLIANGVKQLFSRPTISGAFQMVGAETQAARELHNMANTMDKESYVLERATAGEDADEAGRAYDKLRTKTEDEVASAMIPVSLFGGALEAVPLERLLVRLGKPAKNYIVSAFKNGGIQAAEEATQEVIQQTIINAGVGNTYNEAQRLTTGLQESAEVGGAVGFILGTTLTVLGGKRANIRNRVQEGVITKEQAIEELKDINKAETLIQDKLQALDNQLMLTEAPRVAGLLPERTQTDPKDDNKSGKRGIPMPSGSPSGSGEAIATPSPYEVSNLPEAKNYFDSNPVSETNPLVVMPTQVESVLDKIADGILVSAEGLHDAYKWVNDTFKSVIDNKSLSPAEKGATMNILSGMLSDIDKANTEGQKFVEEVEVASVQDRVPAVRPEGELPQGQAPKAPATATQAQTQGQSIRQARRVRGGTNVLPSSGETIVTPAPQGTQEAPVASESTPEKVGGNISNGFDLSRQDLKYGRSELKSEIGIDYGLQRVIEGKDNSSTGEGNRYKGKPNYVFQLAPNSTTTDLSRTDGVEMAQTIKKDIPLTEAEQNAVNKAFELPLKERTIEIENISKEIAKRLQQERKQSAQTPTTPAPQGTQETQPQTQITDESETITEQQEVPVLDGVSDGGNQGQGGQTGSQLRSQESPQQAEGDAETQVTTGTPEALADVESTAKALEGKNTAEIEAPMLSAIAGNRIIGIDTNTTISQAYHDAKAKPESERTSQESQLITAVEELLGSPEVKPESPAQQGKAPESPTTQGKAEVAPTTPEATGTPGTQDARAQREAKRKAREEAQRKATEAPTGDTEGKVESTANRKKEIQSENDRLQKRKFELASERDDLVTGEGKYKNFGKKERDARLEEIRNETKDIDSKQELLQKELKTLKAKETGSVELFDHSNTGHGSTNTIIYDIKNDKLIEVENVARGKTKDISIADAAKKNFRKTQRNKNEREINEAYTDDVREKYESEIIDEINKYKPTTPTTPESPKAPKKPKAMTDYEARLEERRRVFKPGNIVPSYAGRDRVISYYENPNDPNDWSVTVELIDKDGKAIEEPRTHKTFMFSPKELKKFGFQTAEEIKKESVVPKETETTTETGVQEEIPTSVIEDIDKAKLEDLKAQKDELIKKFSKGLGNLTMNLNPQQVSLLSQIAWKNVQIAIKNAQISSKQYASVITKAVQDTIDEINKILASSNQQPLDPDSDDVTNIINGVRKLASSTTPISPSASTTAGQIGQQQAGAPVFTKNQEDLARRKYEKLKEKKPVNEKTESFWKAAKRKVAEIRQKLDSPRAILNMVEAEIGKIPNSSYRRRRDLPLGKAMEQLRGKARVLAIPYIERINKITNPIKDNLEDFDDYLIFRRIIDRANKDKENQQNAKQNPNDYVPERRTTGGMTATDAEILLNDMKNRLGNDVYDKLVIAGDELQVVFDDNLKDLVKAGILSQERYDNIKAQNEFYVPFDVVQRDFRGNIVDDIAGDKDINPNVVKNIRGIATPKSAAQLDKTIDVFYEMQSKGDIDVDSYYYLATEYISDAMQNGVITQKEYENFMDALADPSLELNSPLNKGMKIVQSSQYQVARQGYMEDVDRMVEADIDEEYFHRMKEGEKKPAGQEIITYYKNGELQRVSVDSNLKIAIDGATKVELGAFGEALRATSSPFRLAATGLSATFLPINFVIDIQRALTSKAGIGSGSTIGEKIIEPVQIPILYGEALIESIIGNLINTKLGSVIGLERITPKFLYNQYQGWKQSPAYTEGTFMGNVIDELGKVDTRQDLKDRKFFDTYKRRLQTILGKPGVAETIANAMLSTKKAGRVTASGLLDVLLFSGKVLENTHKVYGYTKLKGTEAGIRGGLDKYMGGLMYRLSGKNKSMTQQEMDNTLEMIHDEILNNIGSPNFEQIPPNVRFISTLLPFMGAAIKGNMTDLARYTGQTGGKNSKKDALAFSLRNGALYTIPAFATALYYGLQDDDNEEKKLIENLDENTKWKNMVIPFSRKAEDGSEYNDVITIPIRGIPVVFNSLGRAHGEALAASMKETLTAEELSRIKDDLLLSSLQEMLTFNLSDKTFLTGVDPETGQRKEVRNEEEWKNRAMSFASGIHPLLKFTSEQIANKNFFSKNNIFPESGRFKKLRNAVINRQINPATGEPYSYTLLKNKYTTKSAEELSKKLEEMGIGISPITIDHFSDAMVAGAPRNWEMGILNKIKGRFSQVEKEKAYEEFKNRNKE
jgi:hypothetical protein